MLDSNFDDKGYKNEHSNNINSIEEIKKSLFHSCYDSLRDNFILNSKLSFNTNDLFQAPEEINKNEEMNGKLSEFIFLKKKLSREEVAQIKSNFLDRNGKLRKINKSKKCNDKPGNNKSLKKKDLLEINENENVVQGI